MLLPNLKISSKLVVSGYRQKYFYQGYCIHEAVLFPGRNIRKETGGGIGDAYVDAGVAGLHDQKREPHMELSTKAAIV